MPGGDARCQVTSCCPWNNYLKWSQTTIVKTFDFLVLIMVVFCCLHNRLFEVALAEMIRTKGEAMGSCNCGSK